MAKHVEIQMDRKVHASGPRGKAVLLPAIWLTMMNIEIGDQVKLTMLRDGSLQISKIMVKKN